MVTTHMERSELAAHYGRILAEQERTGTSMREVAGNYGVTPATLYAWRRRLREDGESSGGLIAVDVLDAEPSPRSNSQYEVVLPGGVTIRVPSDFDANRLKVLLEVVRAC